MAQRTVRKVSTYKGTWLGKPGVNTTYYFDSKRDGLRVCALKLDGRPFSVRFIKGDGRAADFKVYASIDCDTEAEVKSFVADCCLANVTDDIAINTL